jgi:hypothetical protein
VDGKSFTLDQEIIDAGVPAIKAALAVDVPDIENAEIVIDEPKQAGAPRTATIVKRGMGKGSSDLSPAQRHVLDVLARAPAHENPAIGLAKRLQAAELAGDSGAFDEALRSGELERAVASGEREGVAVHAALAQLSAAMPVPAAAEQEGFS